MSKIQMQFSELNCTLTPLTSIHIGNGKELAPYEYVIKNKNYYRIDPYSVFENLDDSGKLEFTKKVEEGIVPFRTYLVEIYKEEYGYLYKGIIDSKFLKNYQEKINGVKNKNEENQLLINECIGSLRGKYIPGSSIKGAIRGAYLSSKGKNIFNYPLKREMMTKSGKKNPTMPIVFDGNESFYGKSPRDKAKNEDKNYEAKILGIRKITPFNDPFKYVRVGDTEISDVKIAVSQIERVSSDKNGDLKAQAPSYIERILGSISDDVDQELKFKISIKNFDEDAEKFILKAFNEDKKNSRGNINGEKNIDKMPLKDIMESDFIEALNEKFEKVLDDEIKYFQKRKGITALEILEKVKKELQVCKDEGDSALIRLGKGSGFTTFTHLLNNKFILNKEQKGILPASRVLTEKGCPMGWAKIKFELADSF